MKSVRRKLKAGVATLVGSSALTELRLWPTMLWTKHRNWRLVGVTHDVLRGFDTNFDKNPLLCVKFRMAFRHDLPVEGTEFYNLEQ